MLNSKLDRNKIDILEEQGQIHRFPKLKEDYIPKSGRLMDDGLSRRTTTIIYDKYVDSKLRFALKINLAPD